MAFATATDVRKWLPKKLSEDTTNISDTVIGDKIDLAHAYMLAVLGVDDSTWTSTPDIVTQTEALLAAIYTLDYYGRGMMEITEKNYPTLTQRLAAEFKRRLEIIEVEYSDIVTISHNLKEKSLLSYYYPEDEEEDDWEDQS